MWLHRHQLLGLGGLELLNFLLILIYFLIQFTLGEDLVVPSQLLVFDQALNLLERVVADIAQRDAAVLDFDPQCFNDLAPPFLGQSRNVEPYGRAGVIAIVRASGVLMLATTLSGCVRP